MADIYIAYKKDDPTEMFFYRLMDLGINTLEVQLLDTIQDKESEYLFIVPSDGINLFLVGKLLKYDERTKSALFLIKESNLELRKYPRVKLPPNLVKIELDDHTGYILDISLGGLKVQLKKNITGELLNSLKHSHSIRANVILPNGKIYQTALQLVSFDVFKRQLSFKFYQTNNITTQMYKEIIELLKKKKFEDGKGNLTNFKTL